MRHRVVTDTDIALLMGVRAARSIVGASRSVGITRDRATYRIARLARELGGPVVVSARGGPARGTSRLTPLGARILRGGFDSIDLAVRAEPARRTNRFRGTYHSGAERRVELGHGLRLRVAFQGRDGEPVEIGIPPESVLVARGRFPSSARNVLRATVAGRRPGRAGQGGTLLARASGHTIQIGVTDEAVRQLRLARGARVWLYVKATAVRRLDRPATRGSPRS